jgi:hypothetical protein
VPEEIQFVPPGTRLTASGESAAHDLAASTTRTFLCTLEIAAQVEQESVEISVWGSTNGELWEQKPLLIFPQRFYKGETQQVLDLRQRPELRFIRARWHLHRWGRGAPQPAFSLGFIAREIPAFAQQAPQSHSA